MDPRLNTLLMVEQTKSFTKAAAALSLTQPAVSQHIKQLERDMGVTLLIRGDGGVKLTQEGEVAVKHAKRIRAIYQAMWQEINDIKTKIMRLSVGVTHTSESNLIVEALAKYSEVNTGCRIKIVSDSINNLYQMLRTYELDVAIIEGRIADENFNSVMLDTDSLILAVSNDNPLAKKSIVTLDELKKEKLILRHPDSATRNLFISHLESNNVSLSEFNVTIEVDNVATIKDLIRRNFGVSVMAKSAFMDEMKKGKMTGLPIENLSMTREINMMYHKDFEHNNVLQDIIKLYYETIQ